MRPWKLSPRYGWCGIASRLSWQKKIKSFLYGLVREGGRAKEYETAIMWLCDCGLVYKIERVKGGGIPLKAMWTKKLLNCLLLTWDSWLYDGTEPQNPAGWKGSV